MQAAVQKEGAPGQARSLKTVEEEADPRTEKAELQRWTRKTTRMTQLEKEARLKVQDHLREERWAAKVPTEASPRTTKVLSQELKLQRRKAHKDLAQREEQALRVDLGPRAGQAQK